MGKIDDIQAYKGSGYRSLKGTKPPTTSRRWNEKKLEKLEANVIRMDPVLFLGVRKVPLYQVPQKGNQTHHHEHGMVRGVLVVT